jgi:hypothetical protein
VSTQFFDVMGYCSPFWPSDHTYQRVLEMRMARPVGAPDGDVRVVVMDALGGVLFDGRFHGAAVDHADDPELRHFGVVVPVPPGSEPARIVATTPAGSSEGVSPTTSDPPEVALSMEPDPSAGSAAVRLRWDAAAWPVLVVWSEATGEIVGFMRSGDALLPGPAAPADVARLEALAGDAAATPSLLRDLGIRIEASDGVRSRPLSND